MLSSEIIDTSYEQVKTIYYKTLECFVFLQLTYLIFASQVYRTVIHCVTWLSHGLPLVKLDRYDQMQNCVNCK